MPDYSASSVFPASGGANAYRLEIIARTSSVAGGTMVETFAQVVKFRNHGARVAQTGSRSWSMAGAREGSTSGTLTGGGGSSWPYDFPATGLTTVNVYNFFNRYVAFSQGSSTTLSVTVSGTGSAFLTSTTASVTVPLFTAPPPPTPSWTCLLYTSDAADE